MATARASTASVKVRRSKVHGRGVFALRAIAKRTRIITTMYLSVTEIASAQKIRDTTPSTVRGSCAPAAPRDCSKAYRGLVPMSP